MAALSVSNPDMNGTNLSTIIEPKATICLILDAPIDA
jgi:hypothetical protein